MSTSLILAIIIGIIYPIYFLLTYKSTNEKILKEERHRLKDYQQTMAMFWILTILVLINANYSDIPRINLVPTFDTISIVLSLIVIAFGVIQFLQAKITPELFPTVKEKLKGVYHYLPKTQREFTWFIILSVSAGFCEEIIFRLFLFNFLNEYAGLIAAFFLANMLFAITHIGSGVGNLLSSFILGLIFSAMYYFTDNIWIPILLHSLIDINSGVLGFRMAKLEETLDLYSDKKT